MVRLPSLAPEPRRRYGPSEKPSRSRSPDVRRSPSGCEPPGPPAASSAVVPPPLDEGPAGRRAGPEADDGADGPGPRVADQGAAQAQAGHQPGARLVVELLALLALHRQE